MGGLEFVTSSGPDATRPSASIAPTLFQKERSVPVSRLASLLLPSFGFVVFAVTLMQTLFLSQGAQALFRDSDTGWHVRNGDAIVAAASAPTTDHFSYSRAGRPWFAWEWLSDILLSSVHRIAGLPGVALLSGLAIALTAWGAARLSLSLGANLFASSGAMILLLGTTSIHWLARPHVFSWMMALAFLAAAERERRTSGSRMLYVLPFIACLWANLHGSFLLGPAILFIYAIGEWLTHWDRKDSGLRFGMACLASLLATFINPYGWRLHDHVFMYLQNDYLMNHISEFRSFSFHSPGALYVEFFLLAAVVGGVAMIRQRAIAPALLTFALLHLSLYSARHLATAAILALPLSAAALTREAQAIRRLRPLMEYSERLRLIDQKVWAVVPAILILLTTAAGMNVLARGGAVDFNPAMFPVRAANFMDAHYGHAGPAARLFTKDQWGGYLIYRFEGHTKVFIDGRSDFYGQDMLETYAQVIDVKPGWERVLNNYRVGLVLISPESALASALQLKPEWKRVYVDRVAAIYEKVEGHAS